jgi:cytosine/adenosine deaminase-related metal-dependent hydrolase
MAFDFLKKHGFDLSGEVDKIHFGTSEQRSERVSDEPEPEPSNPKALYCIIGLRLPDRPYLWDLHLKHGKISEIMPHDFNSPIRNNEQNVLEARGCLIAPSLCHAHIHLDKCFLLQDPKFRDLQIVNGDFQEAMSLTSTAKQRFTRSDLLRRGRQLVVESIRAGVTAMRAFCEVDGVVGLKCLEAGLELKNEFKSRCDIQICAFAQLPLFSGDHGGADVRRLMEQAAEMDEIDVLGSTPYVEDSEDKEVQNLRWMIDLALKNGKMLDLHLDYHLDRDKRPLIWDVVEELKQKDWVKEGNMQVTLGHCTRLTYFGDDEWRLLRQKIGEVPTSFVGLPTSDLFMMRTEQRFRGSLHIPELINKHGLKAAIAINNVGNAFTPQGNCDPLSIASLGVGLYTCGTKADTDLLYDCVSSRAREAIGLTSASRDLKIGDIADFVIFEKSFTKMRTRKNIAEVVYDPPAARITIKSGVIISR